MTSGTFVGRAGKSVVMAPVRLACVSVVVTSRASEQHPLEKYEGLSSFPFPLALRQQMGRTHEAASAFCGFARRRDTTHPRVRIALVRVDRASPETHSPARMYSRTSLRCSVGRVFLAVKRIPPRCRANAVYLDAAETTRGTRRCTSSSSREIKL